MVRILNRAFVLIVAFAIAVAVFATGASAASRAAPGAFILEKVDSVQALVKQISSNKNVAALYVKHYGMSEGKIVSYFEENLRLTTLKAPLKVTAYYVTKSGKIQSKPKLLPVGTKVFSTPSGEPVLEWRCGNPISKYLPHVAKPTPPKPPVDTTLVPVVEEPATLVASNPPIEIGVLPDAMISSVQPAPVLIPPAAAIEPVAEVIAAPSIIAPPNLTAIKVIVPALLGAVAVRSKSDTPEVPEPMSILTLAAGASGVLFQYRRRNRR